MSLDVYIECPHCDSTLYSSNITHNLNNMAAHAGVYEIVWRPEENDICLAEQLIVPLTQAVADLEANPEHYRKLNPKNGWGSYEGFLRWLQRLLQACKDYPKFVYRVSR